MHGDQEQHGAEKPYAGYNDRHGIQQLPRDTGGMRGIRLMGFDVF